MGCWFATPALPAKHRALQNLVLTNITDLILHYIHPKANSSLPPSLQNIRCLSIIIYFDHLHCLFPSFQILFILKERKSSLPLGFPGGSGGKESAKTQILSLGWEDLLEEDMATHSSILAWRIPMDREAWRATVHTDPKSWTWLRDFTFLSPPLSANEFNIFHNF